MKGATVLTSFCASCMAGTVADGVLECARSNGRRVKAISLKEMSCELKKQARCLGELWVGPSSATAAVVTSDIHTDNKVPPNTRLHRSHLAEFREDFEIKGNSRSMSR